MKRFVLLAAVLASTAAIAPVKSAPVKSVASKAAAKSKGRLPPVKPATAATIKRLVAANKGKAVLVNFWATWCPPCQAEIPGLVQLQRQYAKQGLVVIFVSADDPVDVRPKVQPFLRSAGVTGSWIVKGSLSDFIEQYEPGLETAFDFPRNYLYNRAGKQVEIFGEIDKKGAEAKIKKVL